MTSERQPPRPPPNLGNDRTILVRPQADPPRRPKPPAAGSRPRPALSRWLRTAILLALIVLTVVAWW